MKGQYFSFDAIIASVIFVLALVALLSYWHSVRAFLDYQNDPLSKDAIRVSNLLFTPPAPASASCNNMKQLGLANTWYDRRVQESILDCAKNENQVWLRKTLGTAYGTSIKVTYIDNDTSYLIGGDVPDDAANIVKIRRLATVQNSTGGTYLAAFDISLYR